MRKMHLLVLSLILYSLLPIHTAQSASVCTQIQDRKEYFKQSWDKNWSTATEVIKYQKYIKLVLRNPRCVSSIDLQNAQNYVGDVLKFCPPKKDHVYIGIFGMKVLKQQCRWASKTKVRHF